MSAPLSTNLPWPLANPAWAQALNPIIASPLSSAVVLTGIALTTGSNVINHKLGRVLQGWLIVDQDAGAIIYRSAPLNNLTLTLVTSANVNVSIGVF